MAAEIEVLIAEDHPIFRKGLRQIVEGEAGLKVIAEAEDGIQALELIRTCRPQVAVLDVDMPGKDGLAVAQEVRLLRLDVALILLTMHKNERFFNAAMDCGVKGYVLKDCASAEIVEGIRAVAAGRAYVTPLLTDYLLNRRRAAELADQGTPLGALTAAERSVLRLVAEYKTSKEIAEELFISVRTVDRHRANIATKLDLSGAHALLQFALEHKAAL
ncbi:MAG TPA: response regulator transcription factor [Bryobacteraceae bacterium]|jgi:DNA-binding NarL/FixJ family response regulator|nr:response regulator transcription factor [Bryobacteraceae bacterium]